MQIGHAVYTSETLPAEASGFHVVVLEPTSLALQRNETVVTRTPTGPDNAGIGDLAAMIAQERAGPVIAIVQSIGDAEVSPAWVSHAAPQLYALGGNVGVLNGLDGGYALIGGTGSDRPRLKMSEALTGAPGQIHGVLERNSKNHYTVAVWAVDQDFITDLMPLAFQGPQPWPTSTTPGEIAANTYIAG